MIIRRSRKSLKEQLGNVGNTGSTQQVTLVVIEQQCSRFLLQSARVKGENLQMELTRQLLGICIRSWEKADSGLLVAVKITDGVAEGKILLDADPVRQLFRFAVRDVCDVFLSRYRRYNPVT